MALEPTGLPQARVALVIGNGAYRDGGALRNPPRDAAAMAAALRGLGFAVSEGIDLTTAEMDARINAFAEAIEGAEAALFFFAGHGLQVEGENYLVPVDATLDNESQLDRHTIKLQRQLDMMSARANVAILLLDCCRDNPFVRSLRRRPAAKGGFAVDRGLAVGSGLAEMDSEGSFIAFATGPGTVAKDGDGEHSPFTAALLRHIGSEGQTIADVMTDVTDAVSVATGEKQTPWYHSSLRRRFYFKPTKPVAGATEGLATRLSLPPASPVTPPAAPPAAAAAPPVPTKQPDGSARERAPKQDVAENLRSSAAPPAASPPRRLGWLLWVAVLAGLAGWAGYFLVGPGGKDPTIEPKEEKLPDDAVTASALATRLDGLDDTLGRDLAAFLAGPAPAGDKRGILHSLLLRAQFFVREADPADAVPPGCRLPSPPTFGVRMVATLVCPGLGVDRLKRLASILAALPAETWSNPAFSAELGLARLAVADLDGARRLGGMAFDAQESAALDRLKAALDVGRRPPNQVTLQFAGAFQRANAQAIMDRLNSFGWKLDGVDQDDGAIDKNEIRYGRQAPPATKAGADLLATDLAVQGLAVGPTPNAVLGSGTQLDIYISTPLAAWDRQDPRYAWCYQEYDASKPPATRYLVACHPSELACSTARGDPPAKKQSPCAFTEHLDADDTPIRAGGWANSRFAEAGSSFGAPFPPLPE